VIVYVLSFVVFTLALVGLGVGVLAGRRGIRGTCGGLNGPGGCGACGSSAEAGEECPRRRRT
jgi:hypothetical protein